jgi:hypothetical protein
MTAQGEQTNTAAVCGWKDCWQRQQVREGRAAEEDILFGGMMWLVGKIALPLSDSINFFI